MNSTRSTHHLFMIFFKFIGIPFHFTGNFILHFFCATCWSVIIASPTLILLIVHIVPFTLYYYYCDIYALSVWKFHRFLLLPNTHVHVHLAAVEILLNNPGIIDSFVKFWPIICRQLNGNENAVDSIDSRHWAALNTQQTWCSMVSMLGLGVFLCIYVSARAITSLFDAPFSLRAW